MKISDLFPNKTGKHKQAKTIVRLPKTKSKVELHTTLARVVTTIIESGDRGISTTALLDTGLSVLQLRRCIRMLKSQGALIESKMGEAKTRAGSLSQCIIHYVYKGWE